MRYFFINTDALSLDGASPHDKWFEYGYAFSGGPKSFGLKFGRMVPGDACLMYANKIGIIGVGNVVEPWDGRTYSNPLVYQEPFKDFEYRIKVKWYKDFRNNPLHYDYIRNRLGWNPSQSLQMVKREKDKKVIEQIIKEHRF